MTKLTSQTSIIVVGAGVAGLSAALTAANAGAHVALVYPGPSIVDSEGSTQLAQGGIAAAIDKQDSFTSHLHDTLGAGAGLVDPQAALILTKQGGKLVRKLIKAGFPADRRDDGTLDQGLEAAHSFARIVHAAGDQTGLMLHRFLIGEVTKHPGIAHYPGRSLIELIVADGTVAGITVAAAGAEHPMLADAVILATGGYCGVYSRSTGAPGADGCGILAAARAGAVIADMEFVQFHPTVLEGTRQLISEAVRGAGGVLRDDAGRRFMFDYDPRGELAPRDVVATAVFTTRRKTGASVFLDVSDIIKRKGATGLNQEFPGISAMLAAEGYDWAHQFIPITPAAHYSMGGIATDTQARSSMPGLFAAGEVANTGVHGANRLASNSLLEGLVFGARAAEGAIDFAHTNRWAVELERLAPALTVPLPVSKELSVEGSRKQQIHDTIDAHVGMERNASGLAQAIRNLNEYATDEESGHLAEIGLMIATAALAREESRGVHRRSDFPQTSPYMARSQALTVIPAPAAQPKHSTITIATKA